VPVIPISSNQASVFTASVIRLLPVGGAGIRFVHRSSFANLLVYVDGGCSSNGQFDAHVENGKILPTFVNEKDRMETEWRSNRG